MIGIIAKFKFVFNAHVKAWWFWLIPLKIFIRKVQRNYWVPSLLLYRLISAETYVDFAEGETSWVPGMMEPYNSWCPCVWLDSKLGILLVCNVCEYRLLNLSSGCWRTCQHGGGGIGYWGLTIAWTSLSSLLILSSIFGCCAEAEPGSSTARNEHQKNHEVQPSELQLLRITSASIVICIIKLIKESCRTAYQLCQRLNLLCP
jgi:hypothetical protein